MPQASHSVEVDAPRALFYELVTDFEAYPSFLDDIKEAKVLARRKESWDVSFTAHVIVAIPYTLRLEGKPPGRLSWTLVESPLMSSNHGAWDLEDLGGGRTRATYGIDLQLTRLVPRAVTNALIQTRLPAMLAQWAERARAEAGKRRPARAKSRAR